MNRLQLVVVLVVLLHLLRGVGGLALEKFVSLKYENIYFSIQSKQLSDAAELSHLFDLLGSRQGQEAGSDQQDSQ